MRVLQLSRFVAYPPASGGAQVVHGRVSGKGADDTVVRLAQAGLRTDVAESCVEVSDGYWEYRSRSLPNSVLGYATDLVDAPLVVPSPVGRPYSAGELRRWLAWSDVALVEGPWLFPYAAEACPADTPLVYASHNVEPEMYAHLAQRRLTRPLHWLVRRRERQAVRAADLVVTTSERDADRYAEAFGADGPFHVAYNAAAYEPGSTEPVSFPPAVPDDAFAVVFVGSDHGPNERAVERLLDVAATDRLDDRIRFFVLGTVCSAFEGQRVPENVHLRGFVESLDEWYAAADAAVNPVVNGAGVNVKMPEYFAHGLPVVTTPFGARGVPMTDGTHALVASVEEFPSALNTLCADPEQAAQLGDNAETLTRETLNWGSVSERLFDRLRVLCGEDGQ